jgi:serine/threonine protein kinase/Tol biopolymer transport system component
VRGQQYAVVQEPSRPRSRSLDIIAQTLALTPGSRLGSYEIVAGIGAGGMGEVYKARDPRLNRLVALKLLPAAAAKDTEHRERFEREAQAVAALNHPGIVTIYSVEQADGQFFLTMELVEGRSLADALPTTGLSLDRVLRIAISVADAMAAAHQKGITHRDLKPGNIMLGENEHAGRVKVLDFGLAKLAEAPAPAAGPTTMTALPTAPITGEGRILGTVAYMSPEQAEGRPIDARSDLFSLGVILYEMATGQRPFTGDTSISIISSIVKDTPTPVTELNPALPRDLGRIIRRALSKDLERRYQTAKDLRNDLEELKASLDSGELQTSATASASFPAGADGAAARHRGVVIAAGLVVLALAGGIVYLLATRRPQPAASATVGPSVQDLQITQLTTSGIAGRPVISPDGKYVAYIQRSQVPGPGGDSVPASSVWIRQVATSSNVQIVAPDPLMAVGGLTVTPDGTYVDYVGRARGATARELWRVSFLGGPPKKLLENVVTPIGWSPDGRQMAFEREDLRRGVFEIVLAEADGANPRVLTMRKYPASFDSLSLISAPSVRPAWSLDGRVIAVPGAVRSPDFQEQIVFVDSTSGREHAVPVQGPVFGLDWLDAGSLVVDQVVETGGPSQLWRLAYPSGAVTRLTNDLGSYTDVSLTAARDSLVTTKTDRRVAIWVSDGSGTNAKEVVPATQSSGTVDVVEWAVDRVLFTSTIGGHRSISSIGQDGGTSQEVVTQGALPTTTSDGRTIVFRSTDPKRQGLWKVTDGGRPALLFSGPTNWPSVTHDDRSVVFTSESGGVQVLWMVSIDGGTPTQMSHRFASVAVLSPDGKAVAFETQDDQGRPAYAICNLPDCSSLRFVPPRPGGGSGRITWTPDSTGFLYTTGTPQNLWVESLDGKTARQLTHFTDDRQIADAAWSRDGKRLAIARTTQMADIVLFRGLKR